MQVFLYEYACATGLAPELAAEGRAMGAAAREDLARVPGVTVLGVNPGATAGRAEAAFRERARQADYTLVVAPEFDDLLTTRCQWVVEEGGRLLGPSPAAAALAADKWALAGRLAAAGVPTPPAVLIRDDRAPDVAYPAVCKPRFGAGSQATFLVRDLAAWPGVFRAARAEGWGGPAIAQPYVPGQAASVSFLLGPGVRVPLVPATQILSADGRFHYRGGELPLAPDLAARAVALASRAVDAVPGLFGYVGVDLVLGATDWILEINPRLTTSYVGLRALARDNLMAALLRVVAGEPVPLAWHPGTVRFDATGRLV